MAVRGENSLYFATGLDNSGLQSGVGDAVGLVQGLAGSISKINPFAILATGAITAFATIAKSAYDMMRDFEQAMKEVETISKATQEDFKGISKEVFALSEISPDAPVELAKAYYQIVSAGYDGAKGLKLLETATKAATAGVTDTKTAADGITTVLNAFKISAEEADRVADIMFNTVKLGKTTFEELSIQLSQVAPLAAASGFSFEEVAAAVATLTKQGVPTAQAMTQIRSAIEATTEVLGDGAAKSMTLQNAFQAIYDKAGGSQNELKKLTGRMEAMNAILAITGPNAEGAASDLEAMGSAAGSAEEAFNRMAGSNVNEWQILRNRIKATTEELGNAAVELSSKFAGFFNDLLDDSDSFTESIRRQANEFNLLKSAIESSNTPFEEKLRILRELQSQYPEYLSSLDLDKVSNDNLEQTLLNVADALKEINKEQERRLKLSGASQRTIDAEARVQTEKGLYEESVSDFYSIIEDVKDYAAKNDIVLNFNPSDDPRKIYEDIQSQFDVNPFGEGGRLISSLNQANNSISIYKQRLGEANSELEETETRQENVKRQVYDNAEGAAQIVKEIENIKSLSGLNPFENYRFPDIQDAVKERKELLLEFQNINQIQDVESLEPFLNSEIEAIRKYAEERKRLINTEAPDVEPEKDKKTYSDYLKERKEQFEKYQAVVNQIGQQAANEQFQSLLKLGSNYGEFLKGELEKTTNFAKQQAIAVQAEVSNINLNRPKAESINAGVQRGTVNFDFEIDQTSINAIENQISELNKKIRAALTDEERESLRERLKYWEDRLDIAEGGVDSETALYQDIYRNLSDLTYEGIRDYIKYWKDRLKEAEKGSEKEQEILGRISDAQGQLLDKIIGDAVQQLEAVSGIFRDAGNDVAADMVDGLSSAANQLGNAFKAIESGSTYDAVAAGLGAAIELTGMLVNASEQRKKAESDYYNSVIAQQKEYNRLLNEQLRTQESATDNVFTTDYENKLRQGIEAYGEAQESYLDSLQALSEGVVQSGVRDQANIGNILQGAGAGAALGATIGSIIPGIGTLIGGAVGAVGGALAGLFGGRTNEPEWVSLLQEYPELIQQAEDGQLQLNEALAETLLNQDLVKEGTRTLIEDTLAWQEAMEAAKEQIRSVISDLAGGLGDNLRNSLVDAFRAGEDAAIAMGDTISEVLQDVLSQIIFDKIFSEQFKRLEEEMEDSFGAGGDGTWVDDFARFFEQSQGLTEEFNNALSQARDIAENAGFDVFGDTDTNQTGMAGAITNITEDTANILEGYLNAVRLDVRQSLTVNQQSAVYLSEIANNTSYNRYLESIDGRFANIENQILEFQAQG